MKILSGVLKRFIPVIIIMLVVILTGTFGYWSLSHFKGTLFDCLYMTIITITTIGYGEILPVAQTGHGRVFTMFVAVSGIGAFTYILTNITAIIVSGELHKAFVHYLTLKRINNMKKHFIICGSGEVGYQIAEELLLTKRDFVIIDKNDSELSRYSTQKVNFIYGDGTDESVLEQAGIKEAAGIFAVTGDDNYNLVITFTAKQLNPGIRIISKVKDAKHIDKLEKAGADSVISPYLIGGLRMVSEMVRPAVVSFLDSMLREREKNFRIEEMRVADTRAGKTLESLGIYNLPDALLLSVHSGENWIYNPPKKHMLNAGDTLVFLTTPEDRSEIEKIIG